MNTLGKSTTGGFFSETWGYKWAMTFLVLVLNVSCLAGTLVMIAFTKVEAKDKSYGCRGLIML